MKFSIPKVILIGVLLLLFSVITVYAVDLLLKLPYKKGESFIVTQGYNTSFTHYGKDKYALDFTQSGCKAYGKPVLATADGKVKIIQISDIGYGNAVKIYHGNNLETIYAHLKYFIVRKGQSVRQGEIVGYIGNSGLSSGTACRKHPGTHLHFALYKKQGGRYVGVKPEPMSRYTNFRAGKWYTSDNEIVSSKVKGAKVEKKIWNQKFISYKLTKINNQIYKATLNFKNTGNTTWTKDKVSLNVIGGYKGTAAKFYHKTWLTRLRPIALSKNTAPGKIGVFVFYIQLPKTPGKYHPQFRPVRYLGGGSFDWIGKDVGTFPIEVKKETVPKPTCSISANPSSILKGKYSVLKWKSSNATSVFITNIGKVSLSGSKKVYPASTTTYKMTAKGKGGSAICSVKVRVSVPSSSSTSPPSSSPSSPPADTTPPEVSFIDLNSPQNTSPFEIKWQAKDENAVKSSEIQYKEIISGEWQSIEGEIQKETESDIYSTIFGSENRKTEDGRTYTFRVRATDEFGNQSGWEESSSILIDITIWYVDDDGGADFTKIQDAIDNASSNDTVIVKDGTYRENININKSLIIQSQEEPENTIIEAINSSDCIVKITSSYVNISGFTIQNGESYSGTGLCLNDVNYCNVFNNRISANGASISLYNSNKNKLTQNNLISLSSVSLKLVYSSGNEIYLNNLYNGVYFHKMLKSPFNEPFNEFDPFYPRVTEPLTETEVPPGVISIKISIGKFNPRKFNVKSGEVVSLTITGLDGTHGLIFKEEVLKKVKIYVGRNETRGISFLAPEPGDYNFYCDVTPEHRTAGETGIMHVIENTDPPQDLINIWNSPDNLGNYWADYEEKYPGAQEIGETEIWDTSYIIGPDNIDNYPLIRPFEDYIF